MKCDEAAEFVSALYDGAMIPRDAAVHIGACPVCRVQLKEYFEMGAELRRIASLTTPETVQPLALRKQRRALPAFWQKGRQTMRIPRFAFALLIIAIVGLTSGLAIVGVRAHAHGTAVRLMVATDSGHANPCVLSAEDTKHAECDWTVALDSGILSYRIKLLSKDAERVRLGIRAKLLSKDPPNTLDELKDTPEGQYWFEPGKTLQVNVAGIGPITVTGDWIDHTPYFGDMDLEHNLVPGPGAIHVISPILLQGDRVVWDSKGGAATANGPDAAFWFYAPGNGVYVLSLAPIENAVQGHVENNRISFELGGKPYQFVTAGPITRDEPVWVLHLTQASPPFGDSKHALFGSGSLDQLLSKIQAEN